MDDLAGFMMFRLLDELTAIVAHHPDPDVRAAAGAELSFRLGRA